MLRYGRDSRTRYFLEILLNNGFSTVFVEAMSEREKKYVIAESHVPLRC